MTTRVNLSGIDGNTGTLAESLTINAISHSTDISITSNSHVGLFVASANGNVGIGTSSPTNQFVVKTADGAGIAVENSSGNQYRWAVNSDDSFSLVDSGTAERIRITSAGKVGIGTTSPNGLLEIDGTTSDSPSMYISHDGNASLGTIFGFHSGNDFRLWNYENGAVKFGTNNAERMRIDSSGNVGIGIDSPSARAHISNGSSGTTVGAAGDDLFVEASGDAGITIGAGSASKASLFFGDSSDYADGRIRYDHSDNSMQFATSGQQEHFRLDSSGNLLVGKTTEGVNTIGVQLRPDGFVGSTRSSGTTMYLQRQGSDGEILRFQNGSGTVGSIGVADSGDRIYFAGGGLEGVGIDNGANAFVPTSETGALKDNHLSLGQAGARFENLYLSSRLYTSSITGDSTTASSFSLATGNTGSPFIVYTGQFGVSATERLRIKTNGVTGIGTASPSDNTMITVEGQVLARGGLYNQLSKSGSGFWGTGPFGGPIFRTGTYIASSSGELTTDIMNIYNSGHWGESSTMIVRVFTAYYDSGMKEYSVTYSRASSNPSVTLLRTIGASSDLAYIDYHSAQYITQNAGQPVNRATIRLRSYGAYIRHYATIEFIETGSENYIYDSQTSVSAVDTASASFGGGVHFLTFATNTANKSYDRRY